MNPTPREPLCRFHGHTCGACCWGESVTAAELRRRLRRHTRLFRRHGAAARPPSRVALVLHELQARGGLDLLLAVLLLLPGVGDVLRPWLKRRLTCAFLGFEDAAEERVGCLLHPARGGPDVRQSAFALLPGVGCGSPDYYCLAAHWFRWAGRQEREEFARRTQGLGWFDFSQAAQGYRPDRVRSRPRSERRAGSSPPLPCAPG